MIKKAAVLGLFFLAMSLQAQLIRVPPVRHVVQLGACSGGSPKIVAVTDGASASDCSVGGGATEVYCYCKNAVWSASASSGGISSVAMTAPSLFAVSGSPITSGGVLQLSWLPQVANCIVAGPASGAAAAPICRPLATADIPALPYLSNSTAYAGSASAGGSASSVVVGSITDASVSSSASIAASKLALPIDQGAGTASLRTLGSGAAQAAAGNDARFSDARTPLSHAHAASDTTTGVFSVFRLPMLGGSGIAHGAGLAPDPGSSAGTSRYLREDGSWSSVSVSPAGTDSQVQFNDGAALGGAALAWNKTTNVVTVPSGGKIQVGDICLQRRDSTYWYTTLCGTSLGGIITGRLFVDSGNTASNNLDLELNPAVGYSMTTNRQVIWQSGGSPMVGLKGNSGGTLHITNGSSGVGTLQFDDMSTRPACDSSRRFVIWTKAGGAGVADTVEICSKDSADAFGWRALPN